MLLSDQSVCSAVTPLQSPPHAIVTFLTAPNASGSHQSIRAAATNSASSFNPHRPRLSSTHVYRTCQSNRLRPRYVNCGTSDKLLNVIRHSLSVPKNGRPEQSDTDLEIAAESARFGEPSTLRFLDWVRRPESDSARVRSWHGERGFLCNLFTLCYRVLRP